MSLLIVAVVNSAAAVLIVSLQFGAQPAGRATSVLLGMFLGTVLLGVTRLDVNRRRATGRFADWPVPALRLANIVVLIGWLAGLAALWELALEWSRRFT